MDPPGTNAKIAWGVAVGLGVSFSLFALTRYFANPAPHTMTREWQEASNERLLVRASSLHHIGRINC
jgi:cytochrome c oxidase subunit 4